MTAAKAKENDPVTKDECKEKNQTMKWFVGALMTLLILIVTLGITFASNKAGAAEKTAIRSHDECIELQIEFAKIKTTLAEMQKDIAEIKENQHDMLEKVTAIDKAIK